MTEKHISVMSAEALDALNISPGSWYVDATFGRGGHTAGILNQGGKVIAFDWDHEAVSYGQQHFAEEIGNDSLILILESFSKIKDAVKQLQQEKRAGDIKGILFDFGTSTEQLTSSNRGFSFEGEGPLDMRMDQRLGVTAADILQAVPETQLADLFFRYGGEENSRKIAKAVKSYQKPVQTVGELSGIIVKAKGGRRGKLHPATKVFQALRIAVNSELEEIETALPQALELLSAAGRLVTIAFHEGEDRIAKNVLKTWEQQGKGRQYELIKPSEEEIAANPRSRSARLRIFEKK